MHFKFNISITHLPSLTLAFCLQILMCRQKNHCNLRYTILEEKYNTSFAAIFFPILIEIQSAIKLKTAAFYTSLNKFRLLSKLFIISNIIMDYKRKTHLFQRNVQILSYNNIISLFFCNVSSFQGSR